jgi:hypothetical protein
MKIKSTITRTYTISDKEIVGFKKEMIDKLQDEYEEFDELTADDIPNSIVENTLRELLPDWIEDIMDSSYSTGIIIDTYFDSISFDFNESDVHDLVNECIDKFLAERENDDYTPSSTNGDYSPSNPWDAPGMSVSDFI